MGPPRKTKIASTRYNTFFMSLAAQNLFGLLRASGSMVLTSNFENCVSFMQAFFYPDSIPIFEHVSQTLYTKTICSIWLVSHPRTYTTTMTVTLTYKCASLALVE